MVEYFSLVIAAVATTVTKVLLQAFCDEPLISNLLSFDVARILL